MKNQKYFSFLSSFVITGLIIAYFQAPVYAGQDTADIAETNEDNEIPGFGNAVIDLNSDGLTDGNEIMEFREMVRDYDVSEHSNQEIPGELTKILYGDVRSSGQTEAPDYTEYYLNNLDQATSVKDQLSFGTCWAFSSVAGLESSVLKQRQALNGEDVTRASEGDPVLTGITDTVDISEKYTAWTIYDKDYREPSQDEGLTSENEGQNVLENGGWSGAVEKYWTSWRGVVGEESEPYRADEASDIYYKRFQGEWSLSGDIYPVGDENAPARVNNTYLLPSPAIIEFKDGNNTWTGYDAGATDLIKQTLVETGAVVITYKADQSRAGESGNREFFNTLNWSQYIDSDIVNTNHGVVIVGWNDNYPAENFLADNNSLPPGDGAWLVKNSWGSYDYYEKHYGDTFTEMDDYIKSAETWGIRDENGMGTGYFWLSYYDKSISNAIAFEADIPEDGWDHDRIYQYDLYNDASFNTFVLRMYDTGTTVANVFTAGENEQLDAVSVRIVEPNSRVNVKVYILDPDKDISDPSEGELVSELNTTVELAGFKTLDLDEPVILKPGQIFAVTETIVADSGHENSSVSFLNVETIIDESMQNDNNMILARSSVYAGAGESFAKVLSNGAYVWMTPDMLTNAIGGGVFTFGNALIKAYTTLVEEQMADPGTPVEEQNKDPEAPVEEHTEDPEAPVKEHTEDPEAPVKEATEYPEIPVDAGDPAGTDDNRDPAEPDDNEKPDSMDNGKTSSETDEYHKHGNTDDVNDGHFGTAESEKKHAPKTAASAVNDRREKIVSAGKDHDQTKESSVKNDNSLTRVTAAETGKKHNTYISVLTAAASVGAIAAIKLLYRHKKRQETKHLS